MIRLRPQVSLRRNIRALLRVQLKQAIAAVEDEQSPLATRVHDMRTALKRARGVLKLARPHLRRRGREQMRGIADIARGMAALRDAEIVVDAFDRLSDGLAAKNGGQARPLSKLRRQLAAHRRELGQRSRVTKMLRRAGRALRQLRRRARGLVRRGPGWRAVADGFSRGYRDARRAMTQATLGDTPEVFHAWRKKVKTHAFHVALLVAAGVKELEGRRASTDALGATLGDEHDLAVLEAAVGAPRTWFANPRACEQLAILIEARRRAIRAEVRPLGRDLFAPRPRALRRIVVKRSVRRRADLG